LLQRAKAVLLRVDARQPMLGGNSCCAAWWHCSGCTKQFLKGRHQACHFAKSIQNHTACQPGLTSPQTSLFNLPFKTMHQPTRLSRFAIGALPWLPSNGRAAGDKVADALWPAGIEFCFTTYCRSMIAPHLVSSPPPQPFPSWHVAQPAWCSPLAGD
jgi:hypothetical protein